MTLNDLSAAELAKIDAIAIEFEASLRRDGLPAEDVGAVRRWVVGYDGSHPDVLQAELMAIVDELRSKPIQPKPQSKIGPYVIEAEIGRGGMGVVYRAIDTKFKRTVAIKMLASDLAKRPELNQRFQRESLAIAAINHPNIIALFDVGSHGSIPYVVMEYLRGETLHARRSRESIATEQVRQIGTQIAAALASAHAVGIVHRDLKTQNVMLVSRGDSMMVAKLFDFGLSRVPRHALDEMIDDTHEGTILGTPGFMAPEQARGEVVSFSADVFSLGCVLHECFYGAPAFGGSTNAARMAATLTRDPVVDPRRRRDDPSIAEWIDACLRKDPAQRPTAAQLAQQLTS